MRHLVGILAIWALAVGVGPLAATASFEDKYGRPTIQLTVNGKGPYPFVFDTGSPGLLVMRSLADELKLEVLGQAQLQSPMKGKPVDTQRVRVRSIALGGVVVQGLEAKVLDMDGMGLGKGVVGPAVFREHGPMTIDFRSNTITLGPDAVSTAETWLPLGDGDSYLTVPVRIGDVVIEGHIDTGAPAVLTVPSKFKERLPLTGPVRTLGTARTVDAEFEIRGAPIDTPVRIGDAVIQLGQIQLSELPYANLGGRGLRDLVLHIDWEKQRLGLTGTAAHVRETAGRAVRGAPDGNGPRRMVQSPPPGSGPPFGIRGMPSPDGSIKIADIIPDSPAQEMGLLAGDKIVAINGKPTSELGFPAVRTELATPEVELTIDRDGKTLKLKRSK